MDKSILLSLIVFIGIFSQWVAWRMKLPAILFLLLSGIALGPLTGILDSNGLFGDLLFPIINISVAIILFEGGLTLQMHQVKDLSSVVRRLISVGALITLLITTIATHYALNLSWGISTLFGAITVVTGPTVIVPMLRTIRPTKAVSNILRWEGIIIDPIGALLAVIIYEVIHAIKIGSDITDIGFVFLKLISVGFFSGAIVGFLYGKALKNHYIPQFLKNVVTLALVIFVFTASNMVQHESGILAVTVMGIWLANFRGADIDDILDFKESLSLLLISILFIILAARIDLDQIKALGSGVIIVLLSIQFLSRPLGVWASTFNSKVTWNERHLLCWVAPRGIVAAAISALFALKLESLGYVEAKILVPLTFLVIIFTVTLQSLTARFIALKLGVSEVEPKGIMLIGANNISLNIAKELTKNGFRPLLVDTSWTNIKKARMEGYETYYGDALSEHADKHLDLVGIGKMLALSPHTQTNTLCSTHYKVELGPEEVYTLLTDKDKEIVESRSEVLSGTRQILFSQEITFSMLSNKLAEGWEVKSTPLTENFDHEDFEKQFDNKALRLFAISDKGKLEVYTDKSSPKAHPGWTIISLAPKDEEDTTKSNGKPNGKLNGKTKMDYFQSSIP